MESMSSEYEERLREMTEKINKMEGVDRSIPHSS